MALRKNLRNINYRYHPYSHNRLSNNNNDLEENENNQEEQNPLINLFAASNPFKQLFNSHDDTEVYVESNHIYFKTDVTPESINKLCTMLRHKITEYNNIKHNNLVENLTPKPLYLHISSYGGYLHEAFLVYDYIKNSPIPIYTIVEGYAASAATVMSIAGVKRYITPTSLMLIHQLSTGMSGKFNQLEEELTNSKQDMNKLYDIYVRECHGKMTKKQIIEELKHDKWWNAEKCIKKGLCDEILRDVLV
jgi:ATP-dependent protease ClpP protease subunit